MQVPGSHVRPATAAERAAMAADDHQPLPSSIPVELKAGDGVAYILPLLHWGSCYSTKMRRTLHGGYSPYSHMPGLPRATSRHLFAAAAGPGYCGALPPATAARFEAMGAQSDAACAIAERMLKAAGRGDPAALRAAVGDWHTLGGHADRGDRAAVQTLIMLSKTAKRVWWLRTLPPAELAAMPSHDRSWCTNLHPMTVAWGAELAGRFSPEESTAAWQALAPIDRAMQSEEGGQEAKGDEQGHELLQFEPGFQGGPTRYFFEAVPPEVDLLVAAMLGKAVLATVQQPRL